MNTDIALLRALLQLSHRRTPATLDELIARVRDDARDVQHALASLARAQLVVRNGNTVGLSLAGLAVAIAATSHAKAVAKAKLRMASERATAPILSLETRARRRRAA